MTDKETTIGAKCIAILLIYIALSFAEWSIFVSQWHTLTRLGLLVWVYLVVNEKLNTKENQ